MLEPLRAGSLSWLTSVKIETILIAVAGVMALISAFTSYRNTHAHKYRLLVIGSSDVDVISLSCMSLAVIGLFNVSFGVFKIARKCAMSRNQYIAVVVVSLIGNFIIGIVVSEHKNRVMYGLETSMLQQLKESVETKNRFWCRIRISGGVGHNAVQDEVLRCDGLQGLHATGSDQHRSKHGGAVELLCNATA